MNDFWVVSESSLPIGPIVEMEAAFDEAAKLLEELGEPVTVLRGSMIKNIRVGTVGTVKFAVAKEP